MSWNLFGGGWGQSSSARPPRPPGGRIRRAKAKLSKQASAKMSQFQNGGKTGRFVLDAEDLQIMSVQAKMENLRREFLTQKANQADELEILKLVKSNMQQLILQRIEEMATQRQDSYQHAVQIEFLQEGIPMQGEGDGVYEANILCKLHQADLCQRSQNLYQQQNSAELMEIYDTVPKLKKDFGKAESKLEDQIMKQQLLQAKRRELHEKIFKLHRHINAGYRRAGDALVKRTYGNLLEGDDDSDELKVRGRNGSPRGGASDRPELSKMSYSQRILAVDKNPTIRRSPSPATDRKGRMANKSPAPARASSSSPQRTASAKSPTPTTATTTAATSTSRQRKADLAKENRRTQASTSPSRQASSASTSSRARSGTSRTKSNASTSSGVQRRPLTAGTTSRQRSASPAVSSSRGGSGRLSSPATPRRNASRGKVSSDKTTPRIANRGKVSSSSSSVSRNSSSASTNSSSGGGSGRRLTWQRNPSKRNLTTTPSTPRKTTTTTTSKGSTATSTIDDTEETPRIANKGTVSSSSVSRNTNSSASGSTTKSPRSPVPHSPGPRVRSTIASRARARNNSKTMSEGGK